MNNKTSYKEAFIQAAENFNKAADIDDPEIYWAVLVNTLGALPSWLENIEKQLGKVKA